MPRLQYLTEKHAHDLIATLTEQAFPDSPAFQLRGSEGRHALLSALDQPRWPYYRTLPEKAGVLHYSLNKNHPFRRREQKARAHGDGGVSLAQQSCAACHAR